MGEGGGDYAGRYVEAVENGRHQEGIVIFPA
jgi:hypothetical protein